jgi:PPOX class probable F420-dependent enzyme
VKFDPQDNKAEPIVKRLREDEVGWLVTVHEGTPRPVPVWFLWDGNRQLLIYSSPTALKTKTIVEHPQCSFHFNSDEHGGEIAILDGRIDRADDLPPMIDNPSYAAKYMAALKAYTSEMKTTNEAVSSEFSVPLVMTIENARSW